MFKVRLAEGDVDDCVFEYEAEVAPRVGEILDWTVDSGAVDIYRVIQVRHRLADMRSDGVRFIGVLAVVVALSREEAFSIPR